jgi:hypothetical protein
MSLTATRCGSQVEHERLVKSGFIMRSDASGGRWAGVDARGDHVGDVLYDQPFSISLPRHPIWGLLFKYSKTKLQLIIY